MQFSIIFFSNTTRCRGLIFSIKDAVSVYLYPYTRLKIFVKKELQNFVTKMCFWTKSKNNKAKKSNIKTLAGARN